MDDPSEAFEILFIFAVALVILYGRNFFKLGIEVDIFETLDIHKL